MQNVKYFDTAFKYCKQSIEDKKNNPKAMVNMGLIFKQQQNPDGALKMFKTAKDHDPLCIEAIVNIGAIEYE